MLVQHKYTNTNLSALGGRLFCDPTVFITGPTAGNGALSNTEEKVESSWGTSGHHPLEKYVWFYLQL